MKVAIGLSVVAVVLVGGTYLLYQSSAPGTTYDSPTPSQIDSTNNLEDNGALDVIAENNSLSVSSYDLLYMDTLNLTVTAVDQDYTFTNSDLGVSQTVTMGETQTITIIAAGVGSHEITCGDGCVFTLNVEAKPD